MCSWKYVFLKCIPEYHSWYVFLENSSKPATNLDLVRAGWGGGGQKKCALNAPKIPERFLKAPEAPERFWNAFWKHPKFWNAFSQRAWERKKNAFYTVKSIFFAFPRAWPKSVFVAFRFPVSSPASPLRPFPAPSRPSRTLPNQPKPLEHLKPSVGPTSIMRAQLEPAYV